jgi:nucleoid-associated protein YgaU
MRSIGNIERFLVIGIVVVIGAILAVAIRGADDLNSAYKSANAKSLDPKKGGTPGLRAEKPRTNSEIGGTGTHAPDAKPPSEAGGTKLSPTLQELLDKKTNAQDGAGQKSAVEGPGEKGDPAKPDAPKPGPAKDSGGSALGTGEDAPVVVEEEGKAPPVGKSPDVGGSKLEKDVDVGKSGGTRPEPAPATLVWTYEVQPGDRLERIASSLYGERQMWKEIAAANPSLTDPARLRVGSTLTLPKDPVNTAVVGLSHGTSGEGRRHVTVPDHLQPKDEGKVDAPKVVKEPTPEKAPANSKTNGFKRVTTSDQYQVQRGDTLMAIAATHYGTRSAWRMILDANVDVIPDKDHIKPGIVIKLPAE